LNYLKLSYQRWLVWLLVASVFAAVCVVLSEWQFDRRAHRVAEIALVNKNYDAAPVSLDINLLATQPRSLQQNKWRPVTLSGHYLIDRAILVRNRPKSGQPGFETVVPFITQQGAIIAVSRGWLPTGNLQDPPDRVPLPSNETQTITARLVPSEREIDRQAPAGQVANLNLGAIAAETKLKLDPNWYLILQRESKQPSEKPASLLRPSTDEGNHLSYAIQWIIFGILAFAVLVWAIRREYEFYLSQTDPSFVAKKRRLTRSDKDNDAEDGSGLML
jgi:cytochrome oxidase assembly protein ShyY1